MCVRVRVHTYFFLKKLPQIFVIFQDYFVVL